MEHYEQDRRSGVTSLGVIGRNRKRRAGRLSRHVFVLMLVSLSINALLTSEAISLYTAASILTFLHPLIIKASDEFYVMLGNPALLVSA